MRRHSGSAEARLPAYQDPAPLALDRLAASADRLAAQVSRLLEADPAVRASAAWWDDAPTPEVAHRIAELVAACAATASPLILTVLARQARRPASLALVDRIWAHLTGHRSAALIAAQRRATRVAYRRADQEHRERGEVAPGDVVHLRSGLRGTVATLHRDNGGRLSGFTLERPEGVAGPFPVDAITTWRPAWDRAFATRPAPAPGSRPGPDGIRPPRLAATSTERAAARRALTLGYLRPWPVDLIPSLWETHQLVPVWLRGIGWLARDAVGVLRDACGPIHRPTPARRAG